MGIPTSLELDSDDILRRRNNGEFLVGLDFAAVDEKESENSISRSKYQGIPKEFFGKQIEGNEKELTFKDQPPPPPPPVLSPPQLPERRHRCVPDGVDDDFPSSKSDDTLHNTMDTAKRRSRHFLRPRYSVTEHPVPKITWDSFDDSHQMLRDVLSIKHGSAELTEEEKHRAIGSKQVAIKRWQWKPSALRDCRTAVRAGNVEDVVELCNVEVGNQIKSKV